MKRLLAALFAVVVAASACSGGGGDGSYQFRSATELGKLYPIADRKPAGSWSGTLLDGGSTSLAANRGTALVLNFWASWCAPCRVESPQFDLLYRKMKSQDVQFYGVDTKDAKSNAQAFLNSFDISYPNIYDERGEIALRLGNMPTAALPFTVLIDKRGRVAAVYVGRLSAKDLQPPVEKLLQEPAT
jgi:peroxiredoxin